MLISINLIDTYIILYIPNIQKLTAVKTRSFSRLLQDSAIFNDFSGPGKC